MITVETSAPNGMEFDWEGNLRYKKSWYQVYKCSSQNPFDYTEDAFLFESDCLAKTHSYAYEKWLASDKKEVYTIIQAHDESCRGGYGFADTE
jgi:hypothetical protein